MAYYEHLGGRKYKLITRDPTSITRKRITEQIEVPEKIHSNEKKRELYIAAELAKFVEKVEAGELIRAEKLSLREFLPIWQKGHAEQGLSGYNIKQTLSLIECHVLPKFGDVRLDQIKPLHLVTFMADLKRKDGEPMATNSKLNVYKALKSLFDRAHGWRLIPTNPMDGVERPSAPKAEKRTMKKRKKSYSKAEAVEVITALYALPERWRLYFIGVILGGFRRGEHLACEWPFVDDEACGIHVVNQVTLDKEGNKVIAEVKTEESEAFVPMPRWYMDELKAFRKSWVKEKLNCPDWRGGDHQFLFHSGDGDFYYPSTPTVTWRKFITGSQLPRIRLHDLRHTTAKILRESGADLKTVQERLRHTKISTTADIYMDESTVISRDAADRLEDLRPNKKVIAP